MSSQDRFSLQVLTVPQAFSGEPDASIFPTVDLSLEQEHFRRAARLIRGGDPVEEFRSLVDWLFCQLFDWFRSDCFAFYNGQGLQLQDLISDEQITRYDALLYQTLQLAVKAMDNDLTLTWPMVQALLLEEVG